MSAPVAKIPAYSRSRQTVVCTECKRLKIKCDRQSPCSGCAKRSNDPRVCVYLTANTERPDIGVLWTNQRESDLKIDSLAVRVDEIQDAFLPRKLIIPPLVIVSSFRGTPNIFQLDTISALWTTTLGIPLVRVDALVNTGPAQPTSRLFMVEEAPHLYTSFFAPENNNNSLPTGLRQRAVITAALLKHLPSTLSREALLSSLNSTLIIHPVCSFHHLEARLRFLDDANLALQSTTDISVSFFAVAAAAMTLGSLAYQAERRAWKMQPDFPETERDITKLFDLARLAIRLSGDAEEDRNDVILALLLLIVFTLHSLELDGHLAVVSGVASTPVHQLLGQLLDQLKRKAESKSLLLEVKQPVGTQSLWSREQRRMLAAAVAYYDFYVSDLIGNRLSIDHSSYTTEPPASVDDRTFRPSSTNLPPPQNGNTNHSTLFANQRSRILKVVLQARSEVIYGRDQEKDLMCQAAELSEKEKAEEASSGGGEGEKKRVMPFQSPASDILEMWDERLHQQRENLPRQMVFDASMEYAADVGVVFAGEPRPAGVYENNVTLAMGYTIAQQTELAAFIAYHRMRHAALLLENALVYKPRGAPPHASGTVTMVRILDAAQDLLAAIRVQRHVLKKKMPLGLSNYSYGKRIFDAGVVFGVLSTVSASRNFERNATRAAAEGLMQCIELLKDLEAWLRVKDGVPEPSTPPSMHELAPPRRVLEELAERAGIKIVDGLMEIVGPRRKRALYEMMEEGDSSWDGLILPFLMGGWVVGKSPAPTSWLGPQPEIHTPTSAAVITTTSSQALVPATPLSAQPTDEHRSKRACRTNIGGIAQYPTEVLAGNSSGDEGSAYGDYRAKRKASESTRPTSARPIIAVRARVADGGKRPKRKAPGVSPVKLTKSESPSLDEEDEDRFAYNITKEGVPEFTQYSPTEYPPQQPAPQHQLAPAPAAPVPQSAPSAPAPAPMAVDPRSAGAPAETIAGNDTPHTPQVSSSATFQGYPGEVWNENGGDMFGQSMMQNHHGMYSATGLMLGRPSETYMHHQQQPQTHHHPHHAPPSSQPPSMPVQYSHPPQPTIRHEYQHPHPHMHYPAPHQPQPYSGYSNVDANPRPHLVIESGGMNGAGNQGSQPTSAVTMSDGNTFYSHPSSMPVQTIAPSALYTQPPPQQEQYSSGWNPTPDYYATY